MAPEKELHRQASSASTRANDYLCGVGNWRPSHMQQFASAKCMFIFINLLGIFQGAFKTYTIATLTTLEKRFSLSTKQMGTILIADNISSAMVNIVIGHYASRISKPKMLAYGMFTVGLSSILVALPYGIYGPAVHLLRNELGEEFDLCKSTPIIEDCKTALDKGTTGLLPFSIMLFASFVNGVGQSAFFIAGSTYLDDNVKKKNSPMYFGSTFALRMLGPVLGFMLSAVCLRMYEDPFYDPGIDNTDPRWVGAWWIGYLTFGTCLALASLPMLLFPKVLPSKHASSPMRKSFLKSQNYNFSSSLKKLLKNKLYICQTIATVLFVLGMSGFGTTSPKYLESQFRFSASLAGGTTGSIMLVGVFISFLGSGFLIQRFKPRPRVIASYNVLAFSVMVCGLFCAMLIKCDPPDMPGLTVSPNGIDLKNDCNQRCECSTRVYQPACGSENTGLYFSPCFAGCQSYNKSKGPDALHEFFDCSCLQNKTTGQYFQGNAVQSTLETRCGSVCSSAFLYIIVVVASQLATLTAVVGQILIYLRCIDEEDKNMSLAVGSTAVNLFGSLPYPLIYGDIADRSCQVWKTECGSKGSCWLYDLDKFRYSLFLTTIGFLGSAVVFLIFVAIFSGDIKNFYDDESDEEVNEKMLTVPNQGPSPNKSNYLELSSISEKQVKM